jgi:hypothetical protein
MCQIADPTRYGKYTVTVRTILRFPDAWRAPEKIVFSFAIATASVLPWVLQTVRATFDVRKKAGHAVPTIAVARWGKWRGRLLIGGDAFAGECDGVPSNDA